MPNWSSAAVVIGALRVNVAYIITCQKLDFKVVSDCHTINRGSYMSAHVSLNLFIEFIKLVAKK